MDCVLIRNYFIEFLDRIFYWTEGAKIRQRKNISEEKWDLMEEDDITNNQLSFKQPSCNDKTQIKTI